MDTNEFYSSFDCETLGTDKRPDDYRTAFQIDRDRIIYSHPFRRLQAKTQVFLAGEYDFYRTRLTHSIEVAQVARSICNFLAKTSPHFRPNFCVDPDLVEAVSLAHDLGHPPYGHAGERSLHALMGEHGGFEGNAQTARLLADLFYPGDGRRRGMAPTRALLDGIFKYKTLLTESPGAENHFLYDNQAPLRQWVFGNRPLPDTLTGERLNEFRSLECQIMDWADDTAYSVNDIVDGVNAGFVTIERIERWAESQTAVSPDDSKHLADLLNAIRNRRVEGVFGRKIGTFIAATSICERANFLSETSHRYRFELSVDPAALAEAKLYKRICASLIFQSPQLQQIEYKGRRVVEGLFRALFENYCTGQARTPRILPSNTAHLVEGAPTLPEKCRRVCDFIAGMTDGYAVRTYRRLFDPAFGSLADLSG